MTQTQWGRKETVIFPPHSPIYTYGASFFSLVITMLCVYLHFAYAMTPLQRFYIPYYLRTGVAGIPRNKYVEIREEKPDTPQKTKWPEFKTCKYTTEAIVSDGIDRGELRKVPCSIGGTNLVAGGIWRVC
jgi:hypothetical protein